MRFERIVAALDGSSHGQRVLDAAITQARQAGGSLSLVHALPDDGQAPLMFADMAGSAGQARREQREQARERGKALLAHARELVMREGLECRTLLLEGDPARAICRHAEEHHQDLIVIGSRGLGTVRELMLGSVSHKVAQLAAVPVLIIK
ncbi:universal stress protein [Halomonas alkalicola]|uniref:universal stress protein n=1 Tax=Halomonas alkalicola TaxID=1930622 RepID=UPI00265F49D0|nr:universal stress protein [Halomonas alkalicola]